MVRVGEPYIDACHCGRPKNVRWRECNDCIWEGRRCRVLNVAKCACDHCDMTILANDPWCSVCYLQCRRMRFVEIFDREAPVEAGLVPIWTTISLWWALAYLPNDAPSGSWLVVFGFLIGLHWLFRFGKWMEGRIRSRGNIPL